ncbi:Bromodomain-containing protein [Phyllosticta capitalensis]
MSSLAAQYTPLESLLLFQSLAFYGVETHVFGKISDLLQNNQFVRDAPSYNKDRLAPDALRDLYLRLLKEEVKHDQIAASESDAPTQNGDSPATRKRKAPSPSMPTVEEAVKHVHLLPQLIQKLYARYRRQAVEEIREDERKYDKLARELEEIVRGEREGQININRAKEVAQNTPSVSNSPAASTDVVVQDAPVKHVPQLPQTSPPGSQPHSPALSQSSQDHQRRTSTKIEALMNPTPNGPQNGSASPRKRSAPSPLQPSYPPPHHRTPSGSLPPSARLPPPAPSPGYHASPYGPPGPPTQNTPVSAPSPSSTSQPPVPIASRPPGAPILPPPTNMPFSGPPVQVPSMVESNGPFRPPSGSPHQYPRPLPPGPPGPGPHGPRSPATHQPTPPHSGQHVPPQGPFYPQYPAQQAYPQPPMQHHPAYYQHPGPRQPGGIMLPPFQVAAQDPVRAHQRQMQEQQREQQAATQPRPARSPRAHVVATPARPSPAIHHPPAPPTLPLPTPSARPPFPHRPPPLRLQTAVGSWKKTLPPVANGSPKENLAPVSPISPPSSPEPPPATTPATRSKRPVKSKETPKEMPAPDGETPRPGRATRKGGKRGTRGVSVASSTVTGSVRGRTRSQSIVSHADEPPANVKPEPSTPAETIETDAQSTTEATPTSAGRRTRRRAGTLQSVAEQPTGTANNKRKRDQREESETPRDEVADEVNMASPMPPAYVVASRNFSRMSAPVLNDISSHKHASLFSNPVKAKDAEGYYDIIRRPQDLKSIRSAIQNGSRAVTAATASNADTPLGNSPSQGPSTPTLASSSTHVTLPISEDLVPPKGIVNSAQLERELMRMFANAVMFNSGEDGVVQDAVEMAKDVEASVANWRAAERPSALMEGPTSGVPDEGEVEGGGKRRKV